MAHRLETAGLPFVTSDNENPFIRYRSLLQSYHRWLDAGRDDRSFVALVEALDAEVARIDGRGFRRTPLVRFDRLDAAIGARVWVKDETANVAGSHKGRHLFGLMVLLRVIAELRLVTDARAAAPLAIASCGNAALAAAVVAAAARRRLEVFIPVDADPAVVERLSSLGAQLHVCRRGESAAGDPCYQAFRSAVEDGALPFSCQGPDNGLTIDGGATLAWELAEALAESRAVPDRVVVQVGGGALASACIQGFGQAVDLEVLPWLPTIDIVQTAGAHPLVRAHGLIRRQIDGMRPPEDALYDATQHRDAYMWPWETIPDSVARGILDDETYDWLAVVRGMVATGGSALAVDEDALIEANQLAREITGIDVDATGSAGLAGLLSLARSGSVTARADVVVIFTGAGRGVSAS